MYKYKGDNPAELLNPSNYPLSFGDGDLEVIFDSVNDSDIKWAENKLNGKDSIGKLNDEVSGLCEIGHTWRLLFLSEITRGVYPFKRKISLNFRSQNPTEIACSKQDIKSLKFLISKDADINGRYGTPARICSDLNNIEMLKLLVNYGADIAHNNYSAFNIAVEKGHYEIAEYLSDLMGVENTLDKKDETSLNNQKPISEFANIKKESRKKEENEPKPNSSWIKIDDYSVLYESNYENPDKNVKVEINKIFNFYSARLNSKIQKRDSDKNLICEITDDKDFSKLDQKHELKIAESKFVEQGGILPNSKAGKTTGLVEDIKNYSKKPKNL